MRCTSHDREKASALFEMNSDNIKYLEQQRKVNIHLTNDSNYVRKLRERWREREKERGCALFEMDPGIR